MTPEKSQNPPSPDLFRNRLDNMLNQRHELYRLADVIDWSMFDSAFGELYCPDNGCPAKATRLVVSQARCGVASKLCTQRATGLQTKSKFTLSELIPSNQFLKY